MLKKNFPTSIQVVVAVKEIKVTKVQHSSLDISVGYSFFPHVLREKIKRET